MTSRIVTCGTIPKTHATITIVDDDAEAHGAAGAPPSPDVKAATFASAEEFLPELSHYGLLSRMKAIQIAQTGGPEVMSIREVPTPVPGPGEVLIRVAASGVNFIDLYVREGRYANPVPFIPGQEASGTIAAVGEGVRFAKEGDRVAWCSILGTYAEFALAPADRVVPIPANISFEQAAAVMLQGMTAHYLSHAAYLIRKGDEILVHAGAGGVGLLLTQMAKALGARVTATVSTREKASLSLEAGADEVFQYTKVDFAERINAAGRRMKAVYDSVGKTTFSKSLACLTERGTVVLYGTAGGKVPPFDLETLATGSFYVTRPILKHYTATRSDLVERATAVFAVVSTGQLKLRIERSYSLADAEQAHRDLNGRKTTGKLLLLA